MTDTVCGWDIGGAHLKAARAEQGRAVSVRQVACPLWLGEDHLLRAFAEAGPEFAAAPRHAVTMTGELAEVFLSRSEGVARIVALCEAALAGRCLFYAGRSGLLDGATAVRDWRAVASANWMASAEAAAAFRSDALFVDIGSTTTDLIPIAGGRVSARGETDAERLGAGELVYTGVIRTSLMALTARVPFAGAWSPLMAENFATAADLYRLTDELDAADDLYPASDGRGKAHGDCMARLARMIGRDAEEAEPQAWRGLALSFREAQLRLVHDAAAQVLSAAGLPDEAPVIAAGAGHFLVRELARRLGRDTIDFGDLIPVADDARRMAGVCAPAAAVALLAFARGRA